MKVMLEYPPKRFSTKERMSYKRAWDKNLEDSQKKPDREVEFLNFLKIIGVKKGEVINSNSKCPEI